MKKQIVSLSVILFFALVIASCKKDDPEPKTTTGTTAASQGSFKWTAAASTPVTADSAYYYAQTTTILAFKNGTSNSIEMNLSDLTVGSYSFSPATGNDFIFVSGAVTYTAVSGACNISTAAGNKLSGSFNAALSGGTLTSISGSFQDIVKK